jgi:xanthine/uracil permease
VVDKTAEIQQGLKYGLDAHLRPGQLVLYALQHLTYFLANAAILPVVVGAYLGLDSSGLATLVQRTFIVCGIASILQVTWGHRYPIMEGPAGVWYGVLITLALSAPALGKPLSLLRTDLEMGFIIAGLVCIALSVSGIVARLALIFTPLVNGIFLILIALQLSPAMMKGMLGLTAAHQTVDFRSLLAFAVTTLLIMWITLRGKGFLQSIAVLIGAAAGWLIAVFLGSGAQVAHHPPVAYVVPRFFAWGAPTFDAGVTATCILAAVILLSNLVASINGMSALTAEPLRPRLFKYGAAFTGVSDILAGIGAVIGSIPYASAIGFTAMTGVAARRPFILGSLFLIFLGVLPQVGIFFASMPPSVGNSVMFVVFCLILGIGIKQFSNIDLNNREMCIIGTSCLVGVGVMFLPQDVFNSLPAIFRYLLLNGLVDGIFLAIVMEQVVFREKRGR